MNKYHSKFYVGDVIGAAAPAKKATAPKPSAEKSIVVRSSSPSSPLPNEPFGEMIPYGDPSWYQGWNSPYYKESHKRFRTEIRSFVDSEVTPFAHEWDEAKQLPKEIFTKCAKLGWLGGCCGAPWPTKYAGHKLVANIKPEEYDAFHELIGMEEMCRAGSGGLLWGLFGGLSIGLPPILHFGSDYLKDMVCAPCLNGEKFICLAITEPSAGSDVANLKTTAKKSECGKYYILNGEKKWITNGVRYIIQQHIHTRIYIHISIIDCISHPSHICTLFFISSLLIIVYIYILYVSISFSLFYLSRYLLIILPLPVVLVVMVQVV